MRWRGGAPANMEVAGLCVRAIGQRGLCNQHPGLAQAWQPCLRCVSWHAGMHRQYSRFHNRIQALRGRVNFFGGSVSPFAFASFTLAISVAFQAVVVSVVNVGWKTMLSLLNHTHSYGSPQTRSAAHMQAQDEIQRLHEHVSALERQLAAARKQTRLCALLCPCARADDIDTNK